MRTSCRNNVDSAIVALYFVHVLDRPEKDFFPGRPEILRFKYGYEVNPVQTFNQTNVHSEVRLVCCDLIIKKPYSRRTD